MNLNEYRYLLKTNEEEAISLWNDLFKQGLDVNEASKDMGFSWGAVREEIYALGYKKPRNGLICNEDEKGEKILINKDNKTTLKLTEEEILFLKELYKNKEEKKDDININSFNDYKQRSILISETLLNDLDTIYKENKIYKKQDIFNTIIKLGIDAYFKNNNK